MNSEDIRKVKLFMNENETNYKEFWTCGSDFTKFYFRNYLKYRICIKSQGTIKSIDLDKEDNLKSNEYYLLSNKEFNLEKVINPLLNLDWKNPPQELNYIIEKEKYNRKYKMQKINFENESMKTFFHNQKIGITLSLITNILFYYINGWRIFYFDFNRIINSSNQDRKKYFMYFLNLLFPLDESEEANDFLRKIYYNFNKYNESYDLLLEEIISNFNKDKKILIVFDNIHSKEQYSLAKHLKEKVDIFKNNHIYIREFIEINNDTLGIIKTLFEDKRFVKTIGSFDEQKYDLLIIKEFMEDKKTYLIKYKDAVDKNLSEIFKNYLITKHLDLIKLLYYLNMDEISKNISNQIILSSILEPFINFLYINISDGLIQLKFRNNIIKNSFQNFYIYYNNIFMKEQSKLFLAELFQAEKGYTFERQIIFSIILGNLTNSFERVDIDRIYCVKTFPGIEVKKKNILFYQISQNAPLYDFGVLIEDENGIFLLKVYQVFINKNIDEIKKLEPNKIKYDLCYFIQKLSRILGFDIKRFTFGIIFSKNRYVKHKDDSNVIFIKKYCFDNKYEFLLYDMDHNIFSINKSNSNDTDFQDIKSFEEIKATYFEPFNIFKDGVKIYKKFYIEKIQESSYIKKIKKFSSCFDGELNLKLVAKFDCNISVLEQNNTNLIFYCSKDKNNYAIYYNNFEIVKKGNNIFDVFLEENIKEILVFMNNSPISLKKNGPGLKKKKFILKTDTKELNTNYLISKKEEILLYTSSEEENNEENLDESIEVSDIEFKPDYNDYNYFICYNNFINEAKDLSEDKSDKNTKNSNSRIQNEDFDISDNSGEERELNNKIIDFESNEYKAYQINKETYSKLLNGDEVAHQNIRKMIDSEISKENVMLSKKRHKSFPK